MPAIAAAPSVTTNLRPFSTSVGLPAVRQIPGKVRLVKDLLRVGRWPIGADSGSVQFWDVTAATLADIVRVFARQKAEGQTRPLQWGHADAESGIANVDARQVIDYWDSLFVKGDTLMGVIYVTPADADILTQVNRPVSVGIDYRGNVLTPGTVTPVKNALLHVAVVDQAAMPNQGPFVQMQSPHRVTGRRPTSARLEQVRALRNRMSIERN